jgi:ABC-type multidrug transport system ATPase subunit
LQASDNGFDEMWPAKEYDTAVYNSYAAAAIMAADPAVKTAFEALSAAARPESARDLARIPYVRFFFVKKPDESATRTADYLGIVLEKGFSYHRRVVISDGSWSLPKGKWSLIVGRSGSGKSTFLHLLAGWIGAGHASRQGLFPETLFLLGQRPTLVSEISIEDNIYLFANRGVDVEGILSALGFDDQLRHRKANDELSGGERQRVALGQAIAAKPELLLLDEPCTGVDKVRKYQFFRLIQETLRSTNMTVVCVDHDFASIEMFFDCIFEIMNGRLVRVFTRP